jgi:hypothetical protein
MPAATKLSSAPKETKSPTPNRTDETTVRRLLQQTSGAQPAEQSKDDPRADDPNTIMRLLHQTAQLACSRYDRALRAHLPGMTLGRCAVLIQLGSTKGPIKPPSLEFSTSGQLRSFACLTGWRQAVSSSAYLILMIAALMSWRSPLRPCRSSSIYMT